MFTICGRISNYLHCSFGNSHVEIVEHLVGLRFGSVGFEGMTHWDGILLPTPHRPAIIYRGNCLVAAPEKTKEIEPLINVVQALVMQEMNWNCHLKLKRKSLNYGHVKRIQPWPNKRWLFIYSQESFYEFHFLISCRVDNNISISEIAKQ